MSEVPKQQEELVFVADSVTEFVERRRWQQIHEAREAARNRLTAAPRIRGEHSGQAAVDAVRREIAAAVETYVMEVETLYKRTEPGRKLWRDTEIATVDVREVATLPLDDGDRLDDLDVTQVGDAQLPMRRHDPRDEWGQPTDDPPQVTFFVGGVRDFLTIANLRLRVDAEVLIQAGCTWKRKQRHRTARATVPTRISKEVYRATNALVEHVGPGLEVGDADDGTVQGEYAELLDNLDDSVSDD